MKKLKSIIEQLIEGKKVRGFNLSLSDIYMLIDIYNAKVRKEKIEFINGNCKEVLDKCNIKTKVKGIGWEV